MGMNIRDRRRSGNEVVGRVFDTIPVDGTITAQDIHDTVATYMSMTTVYRALEDLKDAGCVGEEQAYNARTHRRITKWYRLPRS
jgi:Fe2+ or Zn2+ uptake regulation protein